MNSYFLKKSKFSNTRTFLLPLFFLIPASFLIAKPPTVAQTYKEPQYKLGIFWPALTSMILPGFDQYWEGEYGAGASYSSLFMAGAFIAAANPKEVTLDETDEDGGIQFGYYDVGTSMMNSAGLLSAYHSFKTAVKSRKSDFYFIKNEDSFADLLTAPFDFSFLSRPSTYVPLGIIGITAGAFLSSLDKEQRASSPLGERVISTFAISYGAGVGEEAAFRGWLLPVSHYALNSPLLGNILQGTVFGALHYSSQNRLPLVQTVLGNYWGWLTQENGYSIKETIFQHFWWDVIVIGSILLSNIKLETSPSIQLPPISIQW